MSIGPIDHDKETGGQVSRFDRFTLLGLEVCAMAFIVFMAYSTYGASLAQGVDPTRVIHNVSVALNLMMGALFGFVFFAVVRYYEERPTGYALIIGGVVLALVAPFVVQLIRGTGSNDAVLALAQLRFRMMSIVALLPGGSLVFADLVRMGRKGLKERKKHKKALKERKPEMEQPRLIPMGKCYQTPYCREFIRVKCPVFYSKRACWRSRIGCYCDEKVILSALGKESDPRIFDIRYSRAHVRAQSEGLRGTKKGRDRCRKCFLYQFHQKEKYQILSPLAFVVMGVLVWKGLDPFHHLFIKSVGVIEGFAASASFATKTSANSSVSAWTDQAGAFETFFWFVAIVFAVLALSYLMQLVEYVIFKLQW